MGARLSGGSTAMNGLQIGAHLHTRDVLTSTEKTALYTYWNTRHGLGL